MNKATDEASRQERRAKRQVVRILTQANDGFIAEACDVLRAGLSHADWISVDDTGARHQGRIRVGRRTPNRMSARPFAPVT